MKTHNDLLSRRKFLARATQATAAVAAAAGMRSAAVPLLSGADEAEPKRGPRISYFRNGEIHVNEIGKPDGKPLTTGHVDFNKRGSRLPVSAWGSSSVLKPFSARAAWRHAAQQRVAMFRSGHAPHVRPMLRIVRTCRAPRGFRRWKPGWWEVHRSTVPTTRRWWP